jgi:SSS family solute:Na+ symporter
VPVPLDMPVPLDSHKDEAAGEAFSLTVTRPDAAGASADFPLRFKQCGVATYFTSTRIKPGTAMQLALGIGLVVFFSLMVAISLWASKRIHTGEDYIVAGRSLSGIMTTATIMATWFAAETILVTADVVRTDGLQVIVLEPIGIGLCLMLAGLVFARRLWETKLLTIPDIVGSRFGKAAEKLQALVSISYIGWVAVQLLGLAGILQVYFDLPIVWGVVILTVVLTLYTMVGGMWSVAMTDIVQLSLLLVGIVILTLRVLAEFGGGPLTGLLYLLDSLDAELLVLIPGATFAELQGWIGLIVIGVFANVATQDLAQRMFSARSAQTASRSCVAAGILYIVFGFLPVIVGLAGDLLLDESVVQGVIPALAKMLLSPTLAVVFVLTLTAAVTSSVDSGLLAPASVLARNVIGPFLKDRVSLISLTRICVVAIAATSAAMALSGTRAFDLIQGTYSISLPSFVVLLAALYHKDTRPLPGTLTLGVGISLWFYEIIRNVTADDPNQEILSPSFPLILFVLSFAIYAVSDWLVKRFE